MKSFAERLKEERARRGWKQTEVAEKLNVSPQNYSMYEMGREPKQATLIAIAKLYDVSLDYLLGVSEWRNPQNATQGEDLGLSEDALAVLREAAREHKEDCI